jgi:hypothetical protein
MGSYFRTYAQGQNHCLHFPAEHNAAAAAGIDFSRFTARHIFWPLKQNLLTLRPERARFQ